MYTKELTKRWLSQVHQATRKSLFLREKGIDLTQFYDKSPTPTGKSKKHRDNIQKRHQKLR